MSSFIGDFVLLRPLKNTLSHESWVLNVTVQQGEAMVAEGSHMSALKAWQRWLNALDVFTQHMLLEQWNNDFNECGRKSCYDYHFTDYAL